MLRVVVDAVRHGLASANVIGDVFDVRHGAGAGGNVQRGDVDAKPVSRLELIGGRQDVDLLFDDLAGPGRRDGAARELVERLARLGARRIDRPV